MKFFRLFTVAVIVALSAVSMFAQEAETPLDAKGAFTKWKAQNVAGDDLKTFQAAGFSVANSDSRGVVAKFYLEYGPEVSGLHATEFIVQPVITSPAADGKSTTIDVGKPFRLWSEGAMLVKGSMDDRVGSPQITFLMPKGANAVRLTVTKMFGEDGPAQIILGVGAYGAVGSAK